MNAFTVMGIVCLLLAAGTLALTLVDPHYWWERQAWRYANPEAVRPSEAALGRIRGWLVFGAIAFAIMGIVLLSSDPGAGTGGNEYTPPATRTTRS